MILIDLAAIIYARLWFLLAYWTPRKSVYTPHLELRASFPVWLAINELRIDESVGGAHGDMGRLLALNTTPEVSVWRIEKSILFDKAQLPRRYRRRMDAALPTWPHPRPPADGHPMTVGELLAKLADLYPGRPVAVFIETAPNVGTVHYIDAVHDDGLSTLWLDTHPSPEDEDEL